MRRTVIITIALALLALTGVSATDQWPQFRGAQAGVADDDPALPDSWSETENIAWKANIPGQGWSSPVVWGDHVFITSAVSSGEEPAPTRGLFDPVPERRDFGSIPTPFVKHGLVYISSGYPGSARRPVFAIRPGASGDISLKPGETNNEFIVWFQPVLGSYNTSALVYGDYYYTLLDRGFLLCHDARTGKQIYGRQRISAEASGFSASPWAYNGKIFLLSEDGDTFVVQAGPEFKLVGKNSLNEMPLASPAVARGSLFIRTQSTLYRIARAAQK